MKIRREKEKHERNMRGERRKKKRRGKRKC